MLVKFVPDRLSLRLSTPMDWVQQSSVDGSRSGSLAKTLAKGTALPLCLIFIVISTLAISVDSRARNSLRAYNPEL
jgi:hypothetical protein